MSSVLMIVIAYIKSFKNICVKIHLLLSLFWGKLITTKEWFRKLLKNIYLYYIIKTDFHIKGMFDL